MKNKISLSPRNHIIAVKIRGIHTLDFSRKTTNAILSDIQIVDVVK